MNIEITGIHFNVTDAIRDSINKKLSRLEFAKSNIIDLLFKLIKENRMYKVEVTINFRWGSSAHISVDGFDVYEELDKLFDKIESKVKKEKSKIQEHN
jgi:putative sigma-54 modulation protein